MSTLVLYLHLCVILSVGIFFCNLNNVWAKAFGILNAVFALIYAYGYAIYNLWMVITK